MTLRKCLISCRPFLLVLLVGFSFHSQAAVLSFDPSAQAVGLGANASVDLRISGLGDDILTAFDLDVTFDDSILGFQSFTFGTGLDALGLGTLNSATDLGGGVVNVFELSLDFDAVLMIHQPNDFVLGTFSFATLGLGTSALTTTVDTLVGQLVFVPGRGEVASELPAQAQSGSITVVPVPEPATLTLFGLGLLGLGAARWRKKRAA